MPTMATKAMQQAGQIKIINTLFDYFWEATEPQNLRAQFPVDVRQWLQEELDSHYGVLSTEAIRARVVADKVSSLTDDEALKLFQRISGMNPGSVLDRI